MSDKNKNASCEEIDVFCPNCNKIVMAKVKIETSIYTSLGCSGIFEDEEYECKLYKVAFCIRCETPFFICEEIQGLAGEYESTTNFEILYPHGMKSIPEHLPSKVRKAYERALSCFQTGNYEPCAIMSRKCIEALCHELGSTKGSLKQRLETLAEEKKIDTRLLEWADGMRIVGNDAAHDLDIELTMNDARDGLYFVEAIITNVFTLNKKYEEFKNRHLKNETDK